jgi:hypothetical protein
MESEIQSPSPPPIFPVALPNSTEDTFVHFNGRQHGPHSLEQVRQLVRSDEIPADALAWRIGQPDWQRVGTVIGTEPQPVKTNPGLGIASFCIGIAGVFAWFLLIGGAGFLTMSGAEETNAMMALLGLLMMLGTGINLVGTIFGIVAVCRKDARKSLSVVGLTLNGLEMITFVGLMIIGMITE